MTAVPPEAVTAAVRVINDPLIDAYAVTVAVLEAAAPLITAAERDRIIAIIEAEQASLSDGAEDEAARLLGDIADLIAGTP
jgi:hypothetical protein